MSKKLDLSVHQLVDFLLRQGDIDNRIYNRSSMSEGSKIHASYQSIQDSSYISEYPLKADLFINEVEVLLQGRADGIIKGKNRYIIDEIKSTVIDLKEFRDSQLEWHLGQAKCYAFMFMKEQHLNDIGIRLTYIKQGKEKEKLIDEYTFFYSELEDYVINLIEEYLEFYNVIFRRNEEKRLTIEALDFPFENYRDGQRELIKLAYSVALKGGSLFVEAPTGIGKTMSTLFPYIKAIKEEDDAKIFYLTAKGSGKESAMNAIKILKSRGLRIQEILITAKEKICLSKGSSCNPDECPFARAYYNKIQSVLKVALLNYETFDYKTIIEIAKEYEICPFEFQLDLSLFSDVIVCDYNYMYDPNAYLRRYFDNDTSNTLALVDEAHNLVNRSREMYSARLDYNTYLEAKKSVRGNKDKKIKNALNKINKIYKELLELPDGYTTFDELNSLYLKYLRNALDNFHEASKEDHKSLTKECTNLLLEINLFLKIAELFNERYIHYLDKGRDHLYLVMYCLDSSRFIADITRQIKATVFFSATFSPIDYYMKTLGGNASLDPHIVLPSPFPKENLLLMIAPKVSVKYKNRESSLDDVIRYIKSFVSKKVGNYFIYVPSYEYLNRLLEKIDFDDNVELHIQNKEMTEQEKIDFLEFFQEEPIKTNLGFLVIGGAFSEGIDLVSDRLIGAIIIGVGISKINFEGDAIRNYYDSQELPGYDYAYLNPGMNKVMQAVGRVIRSETDKGAILLIDERFAHRNYLSLYKNSWSHYKIVYSPEEVERLTTNFFKR